MYKKPALIALLAIVAPALSGCAALQKSLEPAPQAAIKLEPKPSEDASANLYLNVIDGLLNQRRYKAALAYLDQYATTGKKTPRYLMLRGEALLGTERYQEAAENFDQLLAGEKAMAPEASNGRGRAAAAQGKWDEAAHYFAEANRLRPSSAEFLSNLGYAQLYLDEQARQRAEFNLRQAFELQPDETSIRNNLLLVLLVNQKQDEARSLINAVSDASERSALRSFSMQWMRDYKAEMREKEKGKQG